MVKDPRLPMCLHRYGNRVHLLALMIPLCVCFSLWYRLKKSGITTFIATNSSYEYTRVRNTLAVLCVEVFFFIQKIMTHLFDYPEGPDVS